MLEAFGGGGDMAGVDVEVGRFFTSHPLLRRYQVVGTTLYTTVFTGKPICSADMNWRSYVCCESKRVIGVDCQGGNVKISCH